MRNVEKIFSEMRETVHNGPVAIKKLRESGRKVVGVYCNYTPWELISAAGAQSTVASFSASLRRMSRSASTTRLMKIELSRSWIAGPLPL